MDHGPHLFRGGAIVGHMVPGGHQGPGGGEGAFGEGLDYVLADVLQQCQVGGLMVENVPTQYVVHICPKWNHKRVPVHQREGVRSALSDGLINGDHPIVVLLEQVGPTP